MDKDLNRRDAKGGMMWALIAAVVIFGLLFMWAPWNNSRGVANNSAPGTTTGSSSTVAPAPAAPSTAR
jgi:hypothetical protein